MLPRFVLFCCFWLLTFTIYGQIFAVPYPAQVGDITFDEAIDRKDFQLCNPDTIYQYYQVGTNYKGEKKAIRDYFLQHFTFKEQYKEANGFVVIRFVINCRGEADRFRVQQISRDYKPARFDSGLSRQLLSLTQSLHDWLPGHRRSKLVDSYVYLNFIIKNGRLRDVAP